jgi:eukaryotic-like serine/threonine-protein kinase
MPIYQDNDAEPCLSEEQVVAFSEGSLRPAEIEALHAHLDRCPNCLELVNAAVHHRDDDAGGASGDRIWMATFGAGQLVAGRYRIDRFVGRGGMGEVYLAYDAVLSEPVALKTLLSTISDNPQAIRRLLCEARLARRISHHNVCRVHDVGLHEEPGRVDERLHFLTMEFIDGERLGQLLRTSPMEIPLVIAIARQILAGLGAAHAAGVLHRDLKSDNIMVSGQAVAGQLLAGQGPAEDGAAMRVTITDFGLSQALEGDAAASRGGNERGGSVSYMAPEQILGQHLSPATDLFAFGVVLFEMLCAELPFACDDGSRQTALARLGQKPVAPSQLRPEVPSALDRLVLRCLMEKPEDRFASAEETLAMLDEAAATHRPSAIYTRPLASTRGAQETGSDAVRRVEGLAWARSRDLDSGEVPLVSVAALFKA